MDDGSRRGGLILAYLQLLRLPNVFTVVADVTMGFLFIQHSLQPWPAYACLLAASCALYLAGMVLNDVFDLEVDRQERPSRPLPSGRIAFGTARRLGWSLLVVGWLLSLAATMLPSVREASSAAPAIAGTLLAVAIVTYDTWLKATTFGPVLMGLCRFLNVLLAMSLIRPFEGWPLIWGPAHLIAAAAIGLHIAGITWFAREEATTSRRSTLMMGLVIVVLGWALLAWLPSWLPGRQPRLGTPHLWYILVPLLAAPLARRFLVAISDPKPERVQLAVRQGIWSLIWMDATIALLVAPPIYALFIVALFVPMMLLGRWVYAT